MNLDPLFTGIDDEQREAIEAMPRTERLAEIASAKGQATGDAVEQLAKLSNLPLIEDIQLVDNPTAVLPLRLINAYQCVPIKPSATSRQPKAKTQLPREGPIPLVTLWPPDASMDRWIYAVCGRLPQWHLGNPEQVTNTITQRFGVGADSLEESDIITTEAEEEEAEDEDAAVIRFVNEVVQKAVSDRATGFTSSPTAMNYRSATVLMVSW